MTFHHALSQVEVKARCGDDSKHVMIKAAYIVNLKKKVSCGILVKMIHIWNGTLALK